MRRGGRGHEIGSSARIVFRTASQHGLLATSEDGLLLPPLRSQQAGMPERTKHGGMLGRRGAGAGAGGSRDFLVPRTARLRIMLATGLRVGTIFQEAKVSGLRTLKP
jgi:hypothetical protein